MALFSEKIEKAAGKEAQQPTPRPTSSNQHPGLKEVEEGSANDNQSNSNDLNVSSYTEELQESSQGQGQDQEEKEEDPAALDAYLVVEEGQGNRNSQRRNKEVEVVDAVIEEDKNSTTTSKWMNRSICLMLLLVLAAVTIALSVTLPSKDGTPSSTNNGVQTTAPTKIPPSVLAMTTDNPSLTPTMTPSVSPSMSFVPTTEGLEVIMSEIRRQFLDYIPMLEADLQSRSSPQYRAALWMAQEDRSDFTMGLEFPLNATNFDLLAQFRQRYALVVFYFSTHGEQWMDQCNFMNASAHVCEWKCPWPVDESSAVANYVAAGFTFSEFMGVGCIDGFVTSMEFSLNELSGTLPNELQGLDILSTLVLSNNNIQGTIPFMTFNNTLANRQFGVTVMSLLVLYANHFTVTIPDNIDQVTSLRGIWIGSNQMSETLPSSLGNLPLLFLYADSNLFTGTIPPNLVYESPNRESSLQSINLNYNALTGTLSNEILLPSLSILALSDNAMMSGTLPSTIANSSNLVMLEVSFNAFSGTILPESFEGLTSLQRLALYDNEFSGDGLNWEIIGEMKNLLYIGVGNNHITGTIPTQIAELEQLLFMDIGHSDYYEQNDTFVTGTLPTELGSLSMLTALIVSRNRITGSIPTEFATMSSLQHLGLNGNGFVGTIPTELNQLTSLGTFSVQDTGLVGSLDELCAIQESAADWRQGYSANCLERSVNCSCCTLCCDSAGNCEEN